MVDYAKVQRHIDRGKGIAAKKLGPPFLGYRITGTSAGDFPGGWSPVVTPHGVNFKLFRRRMSEVKLETGIKGAAVFFDIIANMDPFLLGDILVQNDPPYVPGVSYGAGATSVPGTIELNAMALAWHGPVSKAVGARIDRRVTVYRPAASPTTQGDGSKYWESTHDKDLPLVLTAGQYALGSPGGTNASLVPAGISTQHRQSDRPFTPDVPGMLKPVKWFFYLPPMPGYMAREGDTIVDENGARYVVVSPYEQQTGLVGQQLICDRTAAQTGSP